MKINITNTRHHYYNPPKSWVQAEWHRPRHQDIKGSPLGSAETHEAAIQDLITRTNRESRMTITRDQVRVAVIDGKEVVDPRSEDIIKVMRRWKDIPLGAKVADPDDPGETYTVHPYPPDTRVAVRDADGEQYSFGPNTELLWHVDADTLIRYLEMRRHPGTTESQQSCIRLLKS